MLTAVISPIRQSQSRLKRALMEADINCLSPKKCKQDDGRIASQLTCQPNLISSKVYTLREGCKFETNNIKSPRKTTKVSSLPNLITNKTDNFSWHKSISNSKNKSSDTMENKNVNWKFWSKLNVHKKESYPTIRGSQQQDVSDEFMVMMKKVNKSPANVITSSMDQFRPTSNGQKKDNKCKMKIIRHREAKVMVTPPKKASLLDCISPKKAWDKRQRHRCAAQVGAGCRISAPVSSMLSNHAQHIADTSTPISQLCSAEVDNGHINWRPLSTISEVSTHNFVLCYRRHTLPKTCPNKGCSGTIEIYHISM